MKLLQILGASALLGAIGCQSQAAHIHDHWSPYFIGPSMARAFLTYDAEKDGSYLDFQWRKKQDINLTIRRHLFNQNPDNPFEGEDPTVYEPRPPNSIVPRPLTYLFPLPIDSIIGSFEEGGLEEFMQGVNTTTRPFGVLTASFLHDSLGFPETKGDAWRHAPAPE